MGILSERKGIYKGTDINTCKAGDVLAGSNGKYPGRVKRDELRGIYIPKLKVSIKKKIHRILKHCDCICVW